MQVACGSIAGPTLTLPALEIPPVGVNNVLLDPKLGLLRLDQTILELSGLVHGAMLDVRITRGNATTTRSLCASGDVGVLHGLDGLELGDSVSVRQTMPPCRKDGTWATAFVRKLPPPMPKLPPELCAGAESVRLEGLVPDSFVELAFGTDSVLGWTTADSYEMPLPEGSLAGAFSQGAMTATAVTQFVASRSASASCEPRRQ